MKNDIHPAYKEAEVVCACGNTFTTRSTKPLLKVDLCSQCHPFYSGERRIVDTGGQVERFKRRFKIKD
jgi:large subunit ribosomal protein L31